MKLSEMFHRQYLNSGDVTHQGIHATIVSCEVEDVVGDEKPGDMKPVIRCHGIEKGIVVNRTNADALIQAFGDNTQAMIGQEVKLSRGRTLFKGKMVDCVTITPVAPEQSIANVRQVPQQPAGMPSPFTPSQP